MRDVLIHEAHRHPYLELLGTMYLYKLRYAESFGSTAGSCWRLLFVYGLMPWLHKYRIQTRSKLDDAVVATGCDNTSCAESAGEARTLIANTRIVLGLGGGIDRTAAAPWGGGLGQKVFAVGQLSSRSILSKDEVAYKDEIQKLMKENAELQRLKGEMAVRRVAELEMIKNDKAEFEKMKVEIAELRGLLVALEQPSIIEPQPSIIEPHPSPRISATAFTTESVSLRPMESGSPRTSTRSVRLEP